MYPDYNVYNPYYGLSEVNFRNNQPQENTEEVITFNQAIALIRKSIGDEKEDEMFYEKIIKQSPNDRAKEILTSIRDDERKHNQILRRLYYEFTGQMLPVDTYTPQEANSMDYKENLEKALFGELEAVVKYRKILGTMPSGKSYTLLMSIMTDELRHADKYNFLIHSAK